MGKVDALSRMTNLEMGVNDNEDIVVLKPKLFINTTTTMISPEDLTINNTLEIWIDQ